MLRKTGLRVEGYFGGWKAIINQPLKARHIKIIKKAGITAVTCSYPNL
jgi:hypothetical protein